jgi:D-3-phosphoglycerate dehydrogenase
MYKVLIPQDISECGKNFLKEKGYKVIVGNGFDAETIKREIVDCDAVIARTEHYTADVIAAGKKLKVIARYGVGTDNIDVKAAEAQGVYVTIAKNTNVQSVAEHTIALMLAIAKNLVFCDAECKKGNWEIRNKLPGTELYGKTLGIIGLGAIGTATAIKAHEGLGMEIIGYDLYTDTSKLPEYINVVSTLEEVFMKSDVVSLHVPYTSETRNMVNKDSFKMMKPTAILINCARGGIVNEDDLYDALVKKEIAGAAMDVFEQEPANPANKLFTLPNFIASPHNAGLTQEARDAMSYSVAQAVDDVLSGRKPKYPINNPKKA